MKTETEWQARALEVAVAVYTNRPMGYEVMTNHILAFAREYAAEVRAEVERLKDEAGQYRAERNDLQSKLNHANDEVTSLRAQLAASSPANARQLLHDFADYLHRLPDENGWEVGPMQVKFTNGAVSSGPLWVGQDDTRRWADQFLAQLPAPPKENG